MERFGTGWRKALQATTLLAALALGEPALATAAAGSIAGCGE
jgi:hypothetical protein